MSLQGGCTPEHAIPVRGIPLLSRTTGIRHLHLGDNEPHSYSQYNKKAAAEEFIRHSFMRHNLRLQDRWNSTKKDFHPAIL